MTLTAKDVAEITKLLEESSFDELYLELDGVKLSLRRGGVPASAPPSAGPTWQARGGATAAASGAPPTAAPAAPNTAPSTLRDTAGNATGNDPRAADAAIPDTDAQDVAAPLLGTFYRAPKPGAPPFVEIGAQVEEETIIGIIEVMKLMNTVRAGVRGRITAILARDGALVEYGETLLRVSKSS